MKASYKIFFTDTRQTGDDGWRLCSPEEFVDRVRKMLGG